MNSLKTTIDQHRGIHAATGLVIRALLTIHTPQEEGESDDGLNARHEAIVRMESLTAAHRDLVRGLIPSDVDLCDVAAVIDAAIEECEGE